MYRQVLLCCVYIFMCDVITSLPAMNNNRLKQTTYLHDPIPCDYKQNMKQIIVDCSGRSLNYTNKYWFPENTTEIMLQHNVLTVLYNNTINNLYKLERLSLQDNMLTYIEPETFQGLINLQYLNLESNRLDLFSLPVDIFSDLINLSELLIIQSKTINILPEADETNSEGTFPDTMFGNLTNLTHLSISTLLSFNFYFNKEFKGLTKLSSLTVAGPISSIASNSFENVNFVNNLYLLHTGVGGMIINHDALRSFYNITNITYSMVGTGLREAIQTLSPLQNKKLTYFKCHQVKRKGEFRTLNYEDGILTQAMEVLERICIENIVLENNDLLIIDFGWYLNTILNKCLKSLIIFDNIILDSSSIYSLQYLTVLKSVIINGIKFTESFESSLDSGVELYNRALTARINGKIYKQNVFSSDAEIIEIVNCRLTGTIIDLPPFYSTESISLSSFLVSPITVVLIYCSDSLLELSLIDLNLVEICFKPNKKQQIEGLPNLRLLNISFNDLSKLYPEFFDNFPSLEILSMHYSQLSSIFISKYGFRLFHNLSNLQHLDLSYNSLDMLSPNIFLPNPNLTSLNIGRNRFKNIPFDLQLTQKLQILDMSQNAITTLSKIERDQIERNKESLGHFELYLGGNIVSCGCDNLQFLQWLQTTNVMIDEDRNFTCMNKEGVLSFTLAYSDIEGLWRECRGQEFFGIAIGLFSLTIIAFLLYFVWSRNKLFIISSVLQVLTGFKLAKREDYKYHVFIGYSDSEDYKKFALTTLNKFIEEDLSLTGKTFIPDRDLKPGIPITDGIMNAINSSWRVLLMVNGSVNMEGEIMYYTFRSAVYSVSPVNPSRLIIFIEENSLSTLPTEFFSEIPAENVIVFKENEILLTMELKTRLISLINEGR